MAFQSMFLAALALVGAASSAAAAPRKVTLVNKTGAFVTEAYVSPSDVEEWGETLLGDAGLADGARTTLSIPTAGASCKHDLKLTYETNDEAVLPGVDLCRVTSVTLRYDSATDETSADYK